MIDTKDIGNALLLIIGIPIGIILLYYAIEICIYVVLCLLPPTLIVGGATTGGTIGGIMLIFGVIGCIFECLLIGAVAVGVCIKNKNRGTDDYTDSGGY